MSTLAEALSLACRHLEQGEYRQVEEICRQVVGFDPRNAQGHFFLGVALIRQDRLAEALPCLQQAVRLQPNHPEMQGNLGVALALLNRDTEAVECYRRTLQHRPDDPEALRSLALSLVKLGQSEEARTALETALRVRPDYADARNTLGNLHFRQGQFADAVEAFQRVIAIRPQHAEAHNNLGNALMKRGRLAEALASYERAISLRPDYALAHYNRAHLWLLQRDYVRGWEEYEWRWRNPEFVTPSWPQPRWDGSPLNGRRLLLWSEQGLGDVLNFVRYAPAVRARGGSVVLSCPEPLVALLRGQGLFEEVVAQGPPPPPFDVHAPLLSLPRLLEMRDPSEDRMPTPYLQAEPSLVASWLEELKDVDGFRIGIVWQGSPRHHEDHLRSFPLARLAPLAEVPGVRLISLQYGAGIEQIRAPLPFAVKDLGSRLDTPPGSFCHLAAIMKNLDLVLGCDTSAIHLAGALGVPVWVALPFIPDWRWLLEREDSPWYPTLRLFRQTASGDWDSVFQRMTLALRAGT